MRESTHLLLHSSNACKALKPEPRNSVQVCYVSNQGLNLLTANQDTHKQEVGVRSWDLNTDTPIPPVTA